MLNLPPTTLVRNSSSEFLLTKNEKNHKAKCLADCSNLLTSKSIKSWLVAEMQETQGTESPHEAQIKSNQSLLCLDGEETIVSTMILKVAHKPCLPSD